MGIQKGNGEEDLFIEDGKIISRPLEFHPEPGGLGYEFFKTMKKNKHQVAQYIADTGEKDTYESLLERSTRVALNLKSKGYDKKDIICLSTHNHKNSVVPFLAATYLTIKVCSLDPTLSQPDITHLIGQVKPTIFFVAKNAVDNIRTSLGELELEAEIVVFEDSTFDEYLQKHEEEEHFEPDIVSNLTETAIIFFSSGTTGFPKGICQNHFAILSQAVIMMYIVSEENTGELTDYYFSEGGNVTSVSLSYSSLYWISAVLLFSASVLSGTARVLCSSFNPTQFWNILNEYKVSLAFLAPNQAIDVLKAGRPDGINTSNLNVLITGGASITEAHLNELRELLPGTFVCQGYGQTEVAGVLTCFRTNFINDTLGLHYKPESCGRPVPGISYKVVDPETEKLCGPYERGELRVKTRFVMNGYFNLDSSDSFDEEGWLKTGDVVYYDNEYCFFVVDRIKEMLKYRSWHVAPAVLEKAVSSHPAVKFVVVIGIPHEEDGDHPMALVVLNKDYENTTEKEINDFVDQKVDDRQKLRAGVKFIEEVPLTPSGKVRRKYIRSLVLEGKI